MQFENLKKKQTVIFLSENDLMKLFYSQNQFINECVAKK